MKFSYESSLVNENFVYVWYDLLFMLITLSGHILVCQYHSLKYDASIQSKRCISR